MEIRDCNDSTKGCEGCEGCEKQAGSPFFTISVNLASRGLFTSTNAYLNITCQFVLGLNGAMGWDEHIHVLPPRATEPSRSQQRIEYTP